PQISRDRFGLAPLFRINPWISPRRIQECDDRTSELRRQLHSPDSLAISFRLRHSEIPMQLLLGVTALLFPDHHNRLTLKHSRAAHDSRIVPVQTVAVDLQEIGKKAIDVIERVRT